MVVSDPSDKYLVDLGRPPVRIFNTLDALRPFVYPIVLLEATAAAVCRIVDGFIVAGTVDFFPRAKKEVAFFGAVAVFTIFGAARGAFGAADNAEAAFR